MGVDLTGQLSGFKISREDFKHGDCSVKIGCIRKGNHRLLRFDMITSNIGDKDLVLGDPRDPRVEHKFFEPFDKHCTEGLGYRFKAKPFFEYSLRNDDSSVSLSGYKDAFCFDGLEPRDCTNQG